MTKYLKPSGLSFDPVAVINNRLIINECIQWTHLMRMCCIDISKREKQTEGEGKREREKEREREREREEGGGRGRKRDPSEMCICQ